MIISCDGIGLFLDLNPDFREYMLEGGDLGRFLEYSQPGSVRKQVLADWAEHFKEGVDYDLEKFFGQNRGWLERRRQEDNGTLLPLVPGRSGRVFLRESGVAKFLRFSSKRRAADLALALAAVWPSFRAPDLYLDSAPSSEVVVSPGELWWRPSLEGVVPPERATTSAVLGLEERRFRHDVYQALISNLSRSPDAALVNLAYTAAEEALGQRLRPPLKEELEDDDGELESPSPPPPPRPQNWFTMSKIGEAAGGFSSVTVGKAADLVAARDYHITHHAIRTRDTVISRVRPLQGPQQAGRPVKFGARLQVEFTEKFAEKIVAELRRNPEFRPKQPPPLEEFDQNGGILPNLSQPLVLDSSS